VDVDHAARVRRDQLWPADLVESRQDDQLGPRRLKSVAQAALSVGPLALRGAIGQADWHAGRSGVAYGGRIRSVAAHQDDLRWQRAPLAGREQRHQVRPLARDQDADAERRGSATH